MIDPDDLMYQRVLEKLQQDDITASELEVCRKYLNDRSARGGATFTQGFNVPNEAKTSDWSNLEFEDVRVSKREGQRTD